MVIGIIPERAAEVRNRPDRAKEIRRMIFRCWTNRRCCAERATEAGGSRGGERARLHAVDVVVADDGLAPVLPQPLRELGVVPLRGVGELVLSDPSGTAGG